MPASTSCKWAIERGKKKKKLEGLLEELNFKAFLRISSPSRDKFEPTSLELRHGRSREEGRLGMVRFSMQPSPAAVKPSKRMRVEETNERPSSPVAMISGDHSSHERQFTATFDPDILDCNICMEPLSPPIFQCSNGHIACSECCVKLSGICPSCSKPVGKIRCLAIEKLIESLQLSCKHAEYGCTRMISFTKKRSHESACTFAPVSCPVPSCIFSNLVANFPRHFQDMHQVRTLDFQYDSWFTVMLVPSDAYVLLKAEDMLFLMHYERSTLGNIVYISLLGAQPHVDQYSFHLEVKKGKKRLSMEGVPRSILDQESKQCTDFLLIPMRIYELVDGKIQLEVSFRRSGDPPHDGH
ncbi:hypothetical protein R1flu_006064 [Riccia fluitans]|uniref:RING-type E3 ubiquitin transferase n=1 Tax=Riccia fluitans TaxID=41844 RepID=A0ABD1YVU0_9MARC